MYHKLVQVQCALLLHAGSVCTIITCKYAKALMPLRGARRETGIRTIIYYTL